MNDNPFSVFWFRRDLRLNDNVGLYHALNNSVAVQSVFIFDTDILNDLTKPYNRAVSFIYHQVKKLKEELNNTGADLWVFYGKPVEIFRQLSANYRIEAVYFNHDYEPYARQRDQEIVAFCHQKGIKVASYKDQVIFEKDEVLKPDGTPYTVFTPYCRKWKERLSGISLTSVCSEQKLSGLRQSTTEPLIMPKDMGFVVANDLYCKPLIPIDKIANYHKTRDQLGIDGTTRLSAHLRFGTISIRELVAIAMQNNGTYLNELIWREFYMQILWHFPQVVTQSFKPVYDRIPWNSSANDFKRWCNAETGYPIVDAAMTELMETGFMHNRARMIVASFLTKHLLIDWRKGEAFFAHYLTDYELASNNGGWQWAAGSGCDAVPYFRIFSPMEQTRKFDHDGVYIKKWNGNKNIKPIVDHKWARERCLSVYKTALNFK